MPIDLASRSSFIKKLRIFESENFIFFIGTHSFHKTLYYLTIKKITFDTENKTLASSFALHDIIEEQTQSYEKASLPDLVSMLSKQHNQQLKFIDEVFCFFGFFKLYLGYYAILVSEIAKVGKIGRHVINRVEKVKYYPLFTYTNLIQDNIYSLENKYLTLVKYFDFTRQVYFSYSYDITKTLQRNFVENFKKEMVPDFDKNFLVSKVENKEKEHNTMNKANMDRNNSNNKKDKEKGIIEESSVKESNDNSNSNNQSNDKAYDLDKCSSEHFLWNYFHIKEIFSLLQNKMWIVSFIYGFFEQVECNIFGLRFLVSVIARRNRHYAGTRYLKRGISNDGNVANDVETEQILEEISTTWTEQPIISSFIHIRGSVPIYWYQEHNSLLPKPDIKVNLTDIRFEATKRHFALLTKRYGHPCIVCNLTKKQESQKKQETLLNDWYSTGVEYINMTSRCDSSQKIIYHHYDLKSERRQPKFYKVYYDYSCQFIAKTNIFCFIPHFKNKNVYHLSLQNGVIRSNCIDCLDRTNVYQQVIGLAVMVVQLRQMGVKATLPENENEGIYGVLTEIYKRMGHELSTQYAGSLAHKQSIKDNRSAVNKFIDKIPEIFNSCKRYFNNSFNDQHKQSTINLFLGKYTVNSGLPQIWDMYYDLPLHRTEDLPNLNPNWSDEYYQEYATFNLIKDVLEIANKKELISNITIEKYNMQKALESYWEKFDSNAKESTNTSTSNQEAEFVLSSSDDYLITFENYIKYKQGHHLDYEDEIMFNREVCCFIFLDIDHKIQIKNFNSFDYNISPCNFNCNNMALIANNMNTNNGNINSNTLGKFSKILSVTQLYKSTKLKENTKEDPKVHNTNFLSTIFHSSIPKLDKVNMGEVLRRVSRVKKRLFISKYASPRSQDYHIERPKYNLKISSFEIDGNDINTINSFVHPDINYIQNSEYSLVDSFVSSNINFNTYHEFLEPEPIINEDNDNNTNGNNKNGDNTVFECNEFKDDLNEMFNNLSMKKTAKNPEENDDHDYFIYVVDEKCFYKKVKQSSVVSSSMINHQLNSSNKHNTNNNNNNTNINNNNSIVNNQLMITQGMTRDNSPKAKVKMFCLPLKMVDHYY